SAAEDRELAGPAWSMHAAQVGSAATLARFEAVVSHHGLDRAVTIQVPDVRALDAAARGLPEAPLAHADELRRRHALLLADSRFADAMAPSEEVTDPPKPPPSGCSWRRPRTTSSTAGWPSCSTTWPSTTRFDCCARSLSTATIRRPARSAANTGPTGNGTGAEPGDDRQRRDEWRNGLWP